MTNSKKKSSNQMSLFDLLKQESEQAKEHAGPRAGSLAGDASFRAALAEDLKHAVDEHGRELSRYDVAARMSNIRNEEITKSMIDNWTAPSHPNHEIKAIDLAAFVMATGGQRRAASVMFQPAGIFVLPGPQALRAELHRIDDIIKQFRKEKRKHYILLREIERGVRI
jgi:hypothetical protein